MGLGTVGAGVARLLLESGERLARRVGAPLVLRRVLVRDPGRSRAIDLPDGLLTTDPYALLQDPEIDLLVEVMGGLQPAESLIREALLRGKWVITANKEVVATSGAELFALASRHGSELYFEASVAGGIPIIKPLKESLAANRIDRLVGIVNGTTNFILSRMEEAGADLQEALAEAQRLGYAEADPTYDVSGQDAAYKLAILASLAFEADIRPAAVATEGIGRVRRQDVQFAAELGYRIKMLAVAIRRPGGIEVRVHPALVPRRHPLASVMGAYNAILVHGDAVGDLMFYGAGAGSMPTASSVVADLVDAARSLASSGNGRVPVVLRPRPVIPADQTEGSFYVRLRVVDKPGVLGAIASTFGRHQVSIESVIQKGRGVEPVDLVFVTHPVVERNLRDALERTQQLEMVREVANVIRVEEGGSS